MHFWATSALTLTDLRRWTVYKHLFNESTILRCILDHFTCISSMFVNLFTILYLSSNLFFSPLLALFIPRPHTPHLLWILKWQKVKETEKTTLVCWLRLSPFSWHSWNVHFMASKQDSGFRACQFLCQNIHVECHHHHPTPPDYLYGVFQGFNAVKEISYSWLHASSGGMRIYHHYQSVLASLSMIARLSFHLYGI